MKTIIDELGIYGFQVRIIAGFAAAAKRYAGDTDEDAPPVQKTLTSYEGR